MNPHRVETIDDLKAVWPIVVPWLEAALASNPDDTDTLLDVYLNLTRNPEYQLWASDTAAFVTHVSEKPRGRVMHFWLTGGTMRGVQDLYPLVEALGRILGCHHLSGFGRLGWQRSFLCRDEGWKVIQVGIQKEL